MPPVIQTDSLSKTYRRRFSSRTVEAVRSVSLQVPPGAAFGLLGPNGAGKTTFIKMLLSAVRPTAGRALLFGSDAWRPASRRPVGYLPENHRFPTYNTGRQMLDFYAALSGLGATDRKRRAGELLETVGLADRADDRIGKYSKGMLQRLGLAQALMHRPELLILDEPGDGVDPLGRRMIRDILREQQRRGVTIFMNSHLLSEVEQFCDQAAILNRGEVALQGRLADLTHGGGYLLTAGGVQESVRDKLQQQAASAAERNGFLEFRFAQLDAANEAIDLLRASGARIESLEHSRSTLEDVFIRTVERAQPVLEPFKEAEPHS